MRASSSGRANSDQVIVGAEIEAAHAVVHAVRAVNTSTGVCTCRFRSVSRISRPPRPGSIKSSRTRSKASALARKPILAGGRHDDVVVFGLEG